MSSKAACSAGSLVHVICRTEYCVDCLYEVSTSQLCWSASWLVSLSLSVACLPVMSVWLLCHAYLSVCLSVCLLPCDPGITELVQKLVILKYVDITRLVFNGFHYKMLLKTHLTNYNRLI